VDVGSVADASEMHATTIFRFDVSRVSECLWYIYIYIFVQQPHGGRRVGASAWLTSRGTVDREVPLLWATIHNAIGNWYLKAVTHPNVHQSECCF
jgi:hypothetical protein